MKKLLVTVVVLAVAFAFAAAIASTTTTTPSTSNTQTVATAPAVDKTPQAKAEEICKAKNLVGDALKKCVDEEVKKLATATPEKK